MRKTVMMQCVMLLAIASSLYAAAWWDDSGADHLWSNPDNWTVQSDYKPPRSSDTTLIRYVDMVPGGQGPVIENGIDAIARNLAFEVGAGALIEMTMTGGSLTLYHPGANNVFFRLGAGASTGKAVLNMSGGVLTVQQQDNGAGGLFRIGSGYGGEVHMSGNAVINAHQISIDPTWGLVDMRDDALIVLGEDRTALIQSFIDAGTLTAWGGDGMIVYDYDQTTPNHTTVRAIPHDLDPFPAMSAIVASGIVELSWTNYEPNLPGDPVYVDVWFGTDPNKLDPASYVKVVDAVQVEESRTSVPVNVPGAGIYYWQVDSYIYGSTDPQTVTQGPVFMFSALDDLPPSVEAGPDMITWADQPVQLSAVIDDDGVSPVTILWAADDPNVVFSDPAIEDLTVTVSFAIGEVELTVTVQDENNPPVSDQVTIYVYSDACEAARIGAGLAAANPEDIVADCIINLEDFAALAAKWLEDYALTEPIPVP